MEARLNESLRLPFAVGVFLLRDSSGRLLDRIHNVSVSCSPQVLEAWKNLLEAAEGRRVKLVDTADKFRFFSMVRDLMLWMEDVIRLIEAQEKPR